ncbi:hypothetical protein [Clostridium beijerinckii]|nr:hypothetical protein [Clostridium beijerinckii]
MTSYSSYQRSGLRLDKVKLLKMISRKKKFSENFSKLFVKEEVLKDNL